MRVLLFSTALLACAAATRLLDNNLVYRSPFLDDVSLAHDTPAIQARHVEHVRRQMEDAGSFDDQHYPTFYGADFGNASIYFYCTTPFIWTGGINFTHSGAGDPFDTSILLWTRAVPVSPSGTHQLPDQSVPVCVAYKISTSSTLSGKVADSGQAFTSYDVDFTVKVEANGLNPDTDYHFQFSDCSNPSSVSPIGKTRTMPNPNTPANQVNNGKPLTLAVFSCSQFQAGWFNAYGFAAHNTSAQFFIHLGDYIYESLGNGAPIGRQTLGRELATIHDYRQRLNQYRTDTSLVFAHQNAPWITVWYVADNAWKAGTADSNDTTIGCSFSPSGACFTDRKLAAVRAYHEWMPIRQVDADDKFRIWRNFQMGKLLDLTMLDTRQYDRDLTDVYYNTEVVNTIAAFPNRSLMGAAQEKWFFNTLSESKDRGAVWRVVGQVLFIFLYAAHPIFLDLDAWDGYRANRLRVLDHLYNNKISNTVILAGDSHANWVSDLAHPNDSTTYNPLTGEGAIGVEFAGTAVTSGSSLGANIKPAAADAISRVLVESQSNLNLQWSEGSYRGFFTLTIDSHTMKATYYGMRNITFANLDGFATAEFEVKAGANKLSRPVGGGVVAIKAGALKSNGTN
ncbi:hypothetical protein K435DRAFT_828150 [Dendrothele bispora CBS 962.96]|uniref:PhoD-like phosphatase metallophosphatase domain-containing protein n=1 Tax=Dendrothele bispora (strain CBS 962.96) TaxID=1314807 RepID=A0A4S8MAR3_DENBC|nr:hypothetical protein K435DRAFT_828150 [Dendrothele bispora CBS 962.96]